MVNAGRGNKGTVAPGPCERLSLRIVNGNQRQHRFVKISIIEHTVLPKLHTTNAS